MNYTDKIKMFMYLMGQEAPSSINLEDIDLNELRVNLLQEELDELKEGLINFKIANNKEDKKESALEVLDALVDLQYVLSGAVCAFGFYNIFDDAFDIVDTANKSKVCKTKEEAEKTLKYYKEEKNVEAFIEDQSSWFRVKRLSDGKVLKPVSFKHPSFDKLPIIFKQSENED